MADAASPTRQQLAPVAYWADAEANSVAIQLRWSRVPAWHTSAHCEGPQELRRLECQGEPEKATRQHQARAGEGLPSVLTDVAKWAEQIVPVQDYIGVDPARSRTCVSPSMFRRALASVAVDVGWQSADTIKLNFRLRFPGAVHRGFVSDETRNSTWGSGRCPSASLEPAACAHQKRLKPLLMVFRGDSASAN